MDWRRGSSSRVPFLRVQSPEFKPQSHQKNHKNPKTEFVLKMTFTASKTNSRIGAHLLVSFE
jgi:hypothetical protein